MNRIINKYFLIIGLVIISLFLLMGCDDEIKYVPPTPDEVENFQKISGEHTIEDDDVSSYLVVKNQPYNSELLYSLSIFMNFEKGERTNRFYQYYQVDYYLENDSFGYDYHIFDKIDGAKRIYGQNFMPFYNLKSNIKTINYLIKYSFDMYTNDENVSYNKEISYSENIINFDDKEKDLYKDNSQDDDYVIEFTDNSLKDEKFNRYQINILPQDVEKKGHIDVQSFIECSNGKTYPFYGIYHYNLKEGVYYSVSDEKLDKTYNINKIYFIINEYLIDGSKNSYYYVENVMEK